ncbi:MAG: phosphoribosylglycinamide formyltransferase [Desulfonauticus sp.]|nr:phosphoribosylglycinamide formyltransferase [Desulfonauticus sp.]
MISLAVFISGSGSNLQSIINKIEDGSIHAEIKVVVSNNPEAYGLKRAEQHNLHSVVLEHTRFADRQAYERELLRIVRDFKTDYVILAGFMRILSPYFIHEFQNRILNIHPALLPSFPGLHAQAQAADYGVKVAGCTVHFVDEKMDHGPILIQAALPVLPSEDGESLGKRILKWEHKIYPQAISWLAQNRVNLEGRKVIVKNAKTFFLGPADDPVLISPGLEEKFF